MTLFSRIGDVVKDAVQSWLNDPQRVRTIPVPMRHAGVIVDYDSALTVSSYFRAIAYVSQSVAGLPWEVIRETTDRTIRLTRHPVWDLLQIRPNSEMGEFTWRETMIAWALSWGNAVSEIEFDIAGRPIGLWPITPDRVTIRRDPETLQIIYQISNYTTGTSYLPPERVFHLHGLGYDGLQGYSLIALAGRSLGLHIATERYGEDFLGNGAVSTGGLTVPGHLNDASYNRLKEELEQQAKPGQKWKPLLFENGMKWDPMSIPNRDSQMLESRIFLISDVARWVGIPLHKLAELSHATFSNIEEQNIEVVGDAFMPWVHRMEEEADRKLFSGREQNVRTKMNVRGLLRGNDKNRSDYYKTMREVGVYSTNDIRRLEDMDPVGPEGDELIVPLNFTTLKQMVAGKQPSDTIPADTPPAPDKSPIALQLSYQMLTQDAFSRILRRESNRFEQNRHKFAENGGFSAWFKAFSEDQRAYMTAALEPILTSLLLLFVPQGSDSERTKQILNGEIDLHLEHTRSAMSALRADSTEQLEIDIRANHEAKDLVEHIFLSFSQRIDHGNDKKLLP